MTHVVITGGSSGIGFCIAEQMVSRGHAVTLIASRQGPLEEARMRLALGDGAANRVGALACDVREATELTTGIRDAEAKRGPSTHLVTAAGIVTPGRFQDIPPSEFVRQMDVNYVGTVNAIKAVYPGMRARGAGRIGMIASAAALTGLFGYTAYAASKFAVRGLADCLRAEAKPYGISVSVCYPPDTDTPQLEAEAPLRPAETRAIAGTAKVWRPEAVARLMVEGMEKGRFAIYPGLDIWALGRIGSVIAPLLDRHFDSVVRRVQKGAKS